MSRAEHSDFASVVAAPFWLLAWVLSLGRFGQPPYRRPPQMTRVGERGPEYITYSARPEKPAN